MTSKPSFTHFYSQQIKPATLNLVSIEHQSSKIDRSMDKTADTLRGLNYCKGGRE